MKFLISVMLLFSFNTLNAQTIAGHIPINRIMSRIPDSLTLSTSGIADYITSNFYLPREKSRAIFIWIAKNIEYNFDSMFDNSIYETPSDVSERVLKTRVGVCLQYAELFNEIANKTGIKCYVVQGYTKQQGVVDFLPHVWCAAYIDSAWSFIDPTWGSGYISNGSFIKQVNNYYFMTKPEDMIKSHMPFDPLWQFLNYPVTNQEFYERKFRIDKSRPFFNYADTLQTYELESEIEQYISSARRIEHNGTVNSFIAAKLRVLNGKITYFRNKMAADKYNAAVNTFNEGIDKLNEFINLRNNQFESEWDSLQLTGMLDSTEYLFTTAIHILSGIREPEEGISVPLKILDKAIRDTMIVLNEQRILLYAYLKTWK